MANAPAPQVVRVVGKYVLCSEIASGGMAAVHLGRLLGPAGFSRTVAIKRLHPQLACEPEFVSMFLDEARLSARIRHPNVVSTIDVADIEGELLLVMDYVRGESLSALLRRARAQGLTPDVATTLAVFDDVLAGLHAAHTATDDDGADLGIVHRDVSPQNILVGADGASRVADFGVAKAMGRLQTTRDGQIKGKSAYLAPEQIRGKGVDARADLFSASVVLWEMLTGHRLFSGDTAEETMMRVLEQPIAAPSTLAPDVPRALDEVVLAGLSRRPEDRFPSAQAMQEALRASAPRARAEDVAAWVRALASDDLDRRGKLLGEVESLTYEAATRRQPGPSSRVTSGDSRRKWIAASIVAIGVLAGAGWIVQHRMLEPSARSEPVPLSSSTPTPAPAPTDEPRPMPQASSAGAMPTASSTSASTVAAAASHPSRTGPVRAPSKRSPRCDPPYTIDPHGVRIPRPECL